MIGAKPYAAVALFIAIGHRGAQQAAPVPAPSVPAPQQQPQPAAPPADEEVRVRIQPST